jgi:hypothetical protein
LALLLLVISGLIFVAPALWLWKRTVVGPPRATTRCYQCRYDLRGLAAPICPECAAPVLPPGTRLRPPRARRAILCVLAILFSLVIWTAGDFAWLIFKHSTPFQALFPAAYARYQRLDRADDPAAVATLDAYAAGKGSRRAMERAVASVLKTLCPTTDPNSQRRFQLTGPPGEYTGGSYSNTEIASLAAALDSVATSESQHDALLEAIAAAHRQLPICMSSQVDDILCDLLEERRVTRFSSGSGDYRPTRTQPRVLTAHQRTLLTELVLDIQSRHDRAWNNAWGAALEQAAVNGLLTDDQKRRYLEQSFYPEIVVAERAPCAAGDLVPFAVRSHWRTGSGIPVRVRAWPVDDLWRNRVHGNLVSPGPSTTGPNWPCEGWLFLPDKPGTIDLELEVLAEFGPSVIDAYAANVGPPPTAVEQAPWRALLPLTIRKHLTCKLVLLPPTAPRVRMEPSDLSPEQVGDGKPMRVSYAQTPRGLLVCVWPWRPVEGLGFAWDVSIRQNGVEHPIGWAFGPRLNFTSFPAIGIIPDLKLDQSAELVFRSSLGPLERCIWNPTIWAGEVVRPVAFFEPDKNLDPQLGPSSSDLAPPLPATHH